MSASVAKFVWSALFFVFIFVSGFSLSRSGRPYSGVLFNAHKLIALAAAVYLAVTIYRLGQAGGLSTLQLAAAIAAGVCFVALIVTGGLLSAMKAVPPAIRSVHHILPYLALLCTAAGLALGSS
jgi:hypothetical protein